MKRYLRQMVLPQIGEAGQEKIGGSKVLLIGAGGLGLPVAQALVAAGVGQLTILDDDDVELSNLQRQTLYSENDVGQTKISVLTEKLRLQNSDISIRGLKERFKASNAREFVGSHDLVIDGSDNFATKFLINDACLLEKKTWVYGSVSRFEGQVAVFRGAAGCYRCLYSKMPATKIENCAEQGVLGAVAGIIGNYQALEALKFLVGSEKMVGGFALKAEKLLVFDFLSYEQRVLSILPKMNCICSSRDKIELRDEPETCAFGFRKTWKDFEDDQGEKLLLDVRTFNEFQMKHHKEGELWTDQHLGSIERSQSRVGIYLYCSSGKRAREKCLALQDMKRRVFYIGEGY